MTVTVLLVPISIRRRPTTFSRRLPRLTSDNRVRCAHPPQTQQALTNPRGHAWRAVEVEHSVNSLGITSASTSTSNCHTLGVN
uniref:Secreted protein n=1 Tax=Mesocestoides corti TaxID=53468 RepID=A0A5K3G305_MESCO